MLPFPLKYLPKTLEDIKGQEQPLAILKNYIQSYARQKKKAALVYGQIGCGKTAAVYALARQFKAEIMEINSSDLRNEGALNSVLGSALQQRSLFFQNKIILIDEVDNFFGRQDYGGLGALQKLIQDSPYPIILTANDPYDKKLSALRKASELIEFNRLSYSLVAEHLKGVCQKEGINYEEKALNTLARAADGDLRGALIDLQLLTQDKTLTQGKLEQLSERKKTETIFNVLRLIFKSTSVENSLPALDNLDIPLNELFLWLDENLPKEYTGAEELYQAYQKLSRADIFNARITRQQHWRFLVYINNFLTAGISVSKEQKNPAFIKYGPTTRILKLWQAKMKNVKKKDLASKIAQKTHTSQKEALKNVPYFQIIFRNSPFVQQQKLLKQFEISSEEEEWLKERKGGF